MRPNPQFHFIFCGAAMMRCRFGIAVKKKKIMNAKLILLHAVDMGHGRTPEL